MKHYLNNDTHEVFAYESDGSQDHLIPKKFTPIGNAELKAKRDSERDAMQPAIAKAKARAYLLDTDWYVIRKLDTGKEIPKDVATRRAEAWLILDQLYD